MHRTITALSGVVIAAGFIVLSGAVLVLRSDVQGLQAEMASHQAVHPTFITCRELKHHHWAVPGAFAVLPARCGH